MAITPTSPLDAATDVPINAILDWTDSVESDSYKVYFGTDGTKVTNRDSDVYRGDVTDTEYDPRVALTYSTEYHWAIDAVLGGVVTAGTKYSFTIISSTANISGKNYKKRLVALANDSFHYEDIDSQPADMIALDDIIITLDNPITVAPLAGETLTQAVSGATMLVIDSTVDSVRGTVTGTWDTTNTVSTDGVMEPDGTSVPTAIGELTLDTSEPIDMVEAYQKILIVNGALKWVVDFTNTKVTGTISGRITRGMELVGDVAGGKMIVDFWDGGNTIYGFNTTALAFVDTEALEGVNVDGEAVSITLTSDASLPSPPHYYTWTTYGNVTDPTDPDYKGKMPALSTILAMFRGRVALSGNSIAPNSWDMTRQDDPFDLLFLEEDAASAVIGQNAALGQIGDVIISEMPYNDDYIIYGSSNSIWILAGDPAGGGSLDPLNETTGIMGRDAWCKDGDGNTYLFGTDGIYRIAKNLTSFKNLTMEKIPTLIKDLGLDADKQIITMGYDGRQHGLAIGVTTREDGSNENFWYDLRTGGFFPEGYQDSDSLFSQFYYKADDSEYKRLMVGCNDGFIRTFDEEEKNDDATLFSDNLIGHWKMNDVAADTVVVDSSSNANNGALDSSTASVLTATGKINEALDMSLGGGSHYVEVPDQDYYSFGDGVTDKPFSLSAWVYVTDTGNSQTILAKANNQATKEWFLKLSSNEQFVFFVTDDSDNQIRVFSTPPVSTEKWSHIVATYDGSGSFAGLNIYVDGQLDNANRDGVGTYTAMTPTALTVNIGAESDGGVPFQDKIDDVRIYDKELTLAEVVGIYNNSEGTENDPQVSYPIDSYAVLGPKPLSTDDFANSQITDLVMISGGGGLGGSELDTDGLTMDLHVQDTSEGVTEAIKAGATPQYTYTQVGPGRAQNQRPKISGLVAGVKLSNDELGETWAIEKVSMKTKPFGRHK